jgi:hypothetical protein
MPTKHPKPTAPAAARTPCTVADCAKPARSGGLCTTHYQRDRRGASKRELARPVQTREGLEHLPVMLRVSLGLAEQLRAEAARRKAPLAQVVRERLEGSGLAEVCRAMATLQTPGRYVEDAPDGLLDADTAALARAVLAAAEASGDGRDWLEEMLRAVEAARDSLGYGS